MENTALSKAKKSANIQKKKEQTMLISKTGNKAFYLQVLGCLWYLIY
jgi:hypothetical protein